MCEQAAVAEGGERVEHMRYPGQVLDEAACPACGSPVYVGDGLEVGCGQARIECGVCGQVTRLQPCRC